MRRNVQMMFPLFILALILFGGCAKKISTVKSEAQETPATSITKEEKALAKEVKEGIAEEQSGKMTETPQPTTTDMPSMQEEQVTAPPEPQELAMVETQEPEIKPREVAKEIGLQDVFFDFDRAVIREDSRGVLQSNADWLSMHNDARIKIEGHADERGTTEYNLALGENRAQAVKKYLVSLGIEPQRISIISYGEEKPFCNESSEECWQQNRRGHLVLK